MYYMYLKLYSKKPKGIEAFYSFNSSNLPSDINKNNFEHLKVETKDILHNFYISNE